jgi:hypothetical protein
LPVPVVASATVHPPARACELAVTDNQGVSGIVQYRRKPEPEKLQKAALHVAKYEPGKPLDALQAVARMSGRDVEVAEAAMPSGPVLVVRWWRSSDCGAPTLEWEVVEPGDYLTYSTTYDSLGSADDAELQHWYEPIESAAASG